jgi:hypothetical protein
VAEDRLARALSLLREALGEAREGGE